MDQEYSQTLMKHLIKCKNGKARRLIPLELERLNMFPDNFTKIGLNHKNQEYLIKDTRRAFLMGNAMVTGIVKKIGTELIK